ncbi:MAG: radical SAM protein [Pseudomonadota bacterium]
MSELASPAADVDLIPPADAFFPSIPPLNIELSARCNLKCPYCANPTLKRGYDDLGGELFDKIVAEARALGVKIWSLHGVGEPLLRRDLEDLLKVLDATGLWPKWLLTNGTLLSEKRMATLYEAGLRGIYNSLDTLDPDLYARTRGGKVEKAIQNVVAAAAAYPDVQFMVGLMNHREQVVDATIRERFEAIYGALPNVSMHVYENARFPGGAEDWSRMAYERSETCFAPSANFTVNALGEVSLCCADQNTEHSLGNVAERTLYEIWYDRRSQETFRRVGLGLQGCPAVCYKCVLKPSQRRLEDVEPIFYAPLAELIAAARAERDAGDFSVAKRYMDFALLRDPLNEEIKQALTELEALTGQKTRSYLQQYMDGGI